ncbi:MAG: DinB family protein [Acidobacteriota bacterium]
MSESASPVTTALSLGPCDDVRELAARYLEEYVAKIRVFLQVTDDSALWQRPREGTNSLGNLLLHLSGNLELWINNSLGNGTYQRDRGAEFSTDQGAGKEELLIRLEEVVARCRATLMEFPQKQLSARIDVQGYEMDGLGIIVHAVEHMSYHTGQIAWAVKGASPEGAAIELYPQHADE